jgi:AbrB family looped-hinge helix DNA binding protein
MTHRIGAKGQVVIPKEIRDRLGLRPGDGVTFQLDDGGVRIEPAGSASSLRGSFSGHDLVATLEEDRAAEPR